MARTTDQVYDSILESKAAFTELDGLVPSTDEAQILLTDLGTETKVADWRIWTYIYASAISLLEAFFDIFKAEIKEIAATSHYGTLPWWRKASLDFQYGYDLEWDPIKMKFLYATTDADAKIIRRAASSEYPDTQEVVLKVAKLDGTPLTTPEKEAFEIYAVNIAPAGINVTVISQVADDLKFDIEIFYNPLVMSPDGSLILEPSTFPAEDAILAHLNDLDFDGELVLTFLQDDLQMAEGIINPVIREAYSRIGVVPYSLIVDKHQSLAGQFRIDPTIPLSDQITYTAND